MKNLEWTPIGEKMPDNEDFVLITHLCYDDGEWYPMIDMACLQDGEWNSMGINAMFERFDNVVAWMPLPEPYFCRIFGGAKE